MSVALLFPGQGSQAVGMGRDLAAAYPVAAETFQEADEVLGFPLSTLAWEGPAEELVLTKNAQPAILVHSVAVFRLLEDAIGNFSYAAGHSLGEFSAHVAAGTIGFADAVRAVRARGELMFASGEERPGTMAAVLGLDDLQVEAVCAAASSEASCCVPANFNADGQVVISGDVEAVERASALAREAGAKRVLPLRVSGAFHSPLMESAERGLREALEAVELADPGVPVVTNVTAAPVTTASESRELLVRQLTSPVRWAESVRCLVELEVERFLELGPGSVLCGLNRRNAPGVECVSVGTVEEIQDLVEEARR